MSCKIEDYIVLFKSISETEDQDDPYFKACQSAGMNVFLVPVIDFDFINLNDFCFKIKNPDDYAGIIFSSPRCVNGFKYSLQKNNEISILSKWKNHKIYVVGERTGALAEDLGFVVEGKDAGNGSKLAELICKEKFSKPFLYPIGSLTLKNLQNILEKKNIFVDEITIYETKQHPKLEEQIAEIKKNCFDCQQKNIPVYFIYFSPSGLNFTLPFLNNLNIDLNYIQFVTIGLTTRTALESKGFQVTATCSKPSPESLVECLSLLKSR